MCPAKKIMNENGLITEYAFLDPQTFGPKCVVRTLPGRIKTKWHIVFSTSHMAVLE